VHRRIVSRLGAEDADRGLERLRRGGDARDEAAAADRHDDEIELRHLGQHLESHGALAGDDERVLVGMHEHQVVARGEAARVLARFEQILAFQYHGGAVHLGILDLGVRRAPRHHDGRGNREARRVVGHGLRMVAGAHRDDAAVAFGLGERKQLVQRAALLERGSELQVLELEVDLGADEAR
jgi:hypothetical protein